MTVISTLASEIEAALKVLNPQRKAVDGVSNQQKPTSEGGSQTRLRDSTDPATHKQIDPL